eukprot:TRINITY_DN20324_c0_g1_i1.p1 TRINITY_DN20324_c0_g1~~TRINITY_DN20324_c0_g1_i1.p1  ORF type:complete len:325 (-),score=39.70 TRINITY_DN20324_c0_g1_i1:299-1273(-)
MCIRDSHYNNVNNYSNNGNMNSGRSNINAQSYNSNGAGMGGFSAEIMTPKSNSNNGYYTNSRGEKAGYFIDEIPIMSSTKESMKAKSNKGVVNRGPSAYDALFEEIPEERHNNNNAANGRVNLRMSHDINNMRATPATYGLGSALSSKSGKLFGNGADKFNNSRPTLLREWEKGGTGKIEKAGGLGANIGTQEWLHSKEKMDRMQNFAMAVKQRNVGAYNTRDSLGGNESFAKGLMIDEEANRFLGNFDSRMKERTPVKNIASQSQRLRIALLHKERTVINIELHSVYDAALRHPVQLPEFSRSSWFLLHPNLLYSLNTSNSSE